MWYLLVDVLIGVAVLVLIVASIVACELSIHGGKR